MERAGVAAQTTPLAFAWFFTALLRNERWMANVIACAAGRSTEVFEACLETLCPAVDTHTRALGDCRWMLSDCDSRRAAIRSKIDDLRLRDLPDSPVNRLDVVWKDVDVLDRAVVSNDHVRHVIVPQIKLHQRATEPGADNLELASTDTASVDVAVLIVSDRQQMEMTDAYLV